MGNYNALKLLKKYNKNFYFFNLATFLHFDFFVSRISWAR